MKKFKEFEELTRIRQEVEKIDLSQHENDIGLLRQQLDELGFHILGVETNIPKIKRLTINRSLPKNNNETITEIEYLKNPPKECVKNYGRANLIGQSVLYGTFILPTALLELRPENGDIITISRWKPKNENETILIYPIIDYFKTKDFFLKNRFYEYIQRYSTIEQEIIINDNLLLSYYFSRKIDRSKHQNYIYSAHFADKILNSTINKEGKKIDAIIYPSVQDTTESPNIAIKPDFFNEKYEIEEITEYLTVQNGENVFLETLKRAHEIDNYGQIKWKNA